MIIFGGHSQLVLAIECGFWSEERMRPCSHKITFDGSDVSDFLGYPSDGHFNLRHYRGKSRQFRDTEYSVVPLEELIGTF